MPLRSKALIRRASTGLGRLNGWCARCGLGGSDHRQKRSEKVRLATNGLGFDHEQYRIRYPTDRILSALREAAADLKIQEEILPAVYVGEYDLLAACVLNVRSLILRKDFVGRLSDDELKALLKHELKHLNQSCIFLKLRNAFLKLTVSVRTYVFIGLALCGFEVWRNPRRLPSDCISLAVGDLLSFSSVLILMATITTLHLLSNLESHHNEYQADRAGITNGSTKAMVTLLETLEEYSEQRLARRMALGQIGHVSALVNKVRMLVYSHLSILSAYPNIEERIAALGVAITSSARR